MRVPTASSSRRLCAGSIANPHSCSAPPGERRRGGARLPPGGAAGEGQARRGRRLRAGGDPPGRRLRGRARAGRAAAPVRAGGRLRRRRQVHDPGPVQLPAHDGRARPAPARRGPPRGAVASSSARTCMEHQGAPGTAFAVWAPAARARAAWWATSTAGTAALHPMRSLGSTGIWELFVPGRRRRARATSSRSWRPTASCVLKADPFARSRRSCRRARPRWSRSRSTSGRDAEWLEPRADARAARAADVDLRGAPRLLAARRLEDGNRSLTYRELADELSDYARHGLHPRRAAAGDGAPVRRARGATRSPATSRRPRASARPTTSARSSTAAPARASA